MPLKKILPYTTVMLVLAVLYVAYTFYRRHEADVNAQARLQAKAEASRKQTLNAVFGNGEIKFSTFEIDASSIHPGQTVQLCYGVENATTVKIDPLVQELKPTYRHCIDIAPKHTTTYTITATDGKGHSKSESLELKVR